MVLKSHPAISQVHAIMHSEKNLNTYAHGISCLKDILEDEIGEVCDEFKLPEKKTKLNINRTQYCTLLQAVSDTLLIDAGHQVFMTIRPSEFSSVGMSTLGLCKPHNPLSHGCSKYHAGSRNLLPLMRRGNRNLGPDVLLKYSIKQLKMKRSELNALLRRIGDLY